VNRFLETMADRSRDRLERSRYNRSDEETREAVSFAPAPRQLGDIGNVFGLITEIKPRSPAEGDLPDRDSAALAVSYQTAGAAIISVLTEPSEFGGSLSDLAHVRSTVSVPIMAKDFLVDPYQIHEARAAGADGVLLIVRLLGSSRLEAMLETTASLGMFALIEAFDEIDLEIISQLSQAQERLIVGVNCRDLETLQVRPQRLAALAGSLPQGSVKVAESSLTSPSDVERVAALGYDLALVGSALMRSDSPETLTARMLEAGRRVRAGLRS
jgi:indole-3-glycerol phosphate synthase